MVRVVVTGLGVVTPVGNTVSEMWEAIVNGNSGVGPITYFDASSYITQIAAQVKSFSPSPYLTLVPLDGKIGNGRVQPIFASNA